jgi:hypothetical protein
MLKIIAVVCFLGAIFAGHWFFNEQPKRQAMDDVRANLVDPDSAKFSEVRHNKEKGGSCGVVNSKNRMGGFSGPTVFLVLKNGSVYFQPPRHSDTDSTKEQIKSLQERIAFAELVEEHCPEI